MPRPQKVIISLIFINIFFVNFDQVQSQEKTNLHNTPKITETQTPEKNNKTLLQQNIKLSPAENKTSYDWKDRLDMAESFFTILAILAGGYWAIREFILRRQKYPHANLKHNIEHLSISDKKVLLSIKVQIENIGEILLELESSFTRIYRILPISDDDKLLIETDRMRRNEDGSEIEWPEIGDIEIQYNRGDVEIEPGESDEICYDFILNSNEQVIIVYTYLKNIKKSDPERGWPVTSIYDLR